MSARAQRIRGSPDPGGRERRAREEPGLVVRAQRKPEGGGDEGGGGEGGGSEGGGSEDGGGEGDGRDGRDSKGDGG